MALQRPGDGAGLSRVDDAGLGQHHQMRPVDAAEAVDMVRPRAVEQRREHGVAVDRIGKARWSSVRAGVGHAHPFSPASMTPRTMKRCSTRKTSSVGIVASAAPVMIISHRIACSTAKLERPTGSV